MVSVCPSVCFVTARNSTHGKTGNSSEVTPVASVAYVCGNAAV